MTLQNLKETFDNVSVKCASVPRYGIELSKTFQREFEEYINSSGSYGGYSGVVFDRGIVVLYSPNNKISFIPSVGFVLAKTLVEYLTVLYDYRNLAFQSLGQEYTSGGQGKTKIADLKGKSLPADAKARLQNFGLNPSDIDKLSSFLTDYESWGGGKTIDRGDFFCSPLMKCAGLQAETQSAIAEIAKIFLDNPALVNSLTYSEITLDAAASGEKEEASSSGSPSKHIGQNIILYGVPGAGKSWTVENEFCKDEKRMERVVFHPDYSYSDFIGQIVPVLKGDKVLYKFAPGPFTKILRKAIADTDKESHYYLIIEEINRGNAPAVFGDIFQLLDRAKKDSAKIKAGTSIYGITNPDIAKSIFLPDFPNATDKEIEDIETWPIRIPSNLSIIGTMNTSDQNVFTLDTAFQRRWQMRLIENDLNSERHHDILHSLVGDSTITWKHFLEVINDKIISENSGMHSCEDKRLGIYFVSQEDLVSAKLWAEKTLKYLWDDAFKFSRDAVFNTEAFYSLDAIIAQFECKKGNERFSVFSADVRESLFPPQPEEK